MATTAELLIELSEKKLSDETAAYIAGIVGDEFPESPESLLEIIGPFLWDAQAINSEPEGIAFCRKLLNKNDLGSDDAVLKSIRMEAPIKVMDLIRTIVEKKPLVTETNPDTEVSLTGGGFDDPFLGLQKTQANFNTFMPINESMKLAKALAKKREKQLRMMKQWEKSKQPLPAPRKLHGDVQMTKLQDILVPQFSVSVAGRELLKDASLRLVLGRRYGLVGRNGIGKTTFLSALVRGEIPGIGPHVNVGCVEQDFSEQLTQLTPLKLVMKVDEEREVLIAEEKRLSAEPPNDEIGKRLTWIYSRLEEIDADRAEAEAAQILSGLGLSREMFSVKKVCELSGGWRMRVMLARLLFADPDILCLDEPTNHLDLHAVAWLTNYLRTSGKTCIIVSHARDFLNDVCTDIMEFRDRTLTYWSGDYNCFETAKADKLKLQQRQFESQEMRRAHVQKFVDRFRANANRASQVQSRIKALSKLPMLEAVVEDPSLHFNFANPQPLPTPMLVMQDASFAWDPSKAAKSEFLLNAVDFSADLQIRAAICGVNGSGKSTFLKLLMGHIEPTKGMVFRHNKLKIGYFAQHHVDGLDLTKNAVQQLQARYPDAKMTDEVARAFLGRFGITGMLALEPLFILSGGQKSRVAIAVMAFAEPHVLVLDEPTNHLDLDAVQALIAALNNYEGGVVLVSHDTHLLSCVVEDVYHVDPVKHTISKLNIDFEEYKNSLLRKKPILAQN